MLYHGGSRVCVVRGFQSARKRWQLTPTSFLSAGRRGLCGNSPLKMADSRAPVEDLCSVTPYPNVRATPEPVKFSAVTAGVPAVLHLYTS